MGVTVPLAEITPLVAGVTAIRSTPGGPFVGGNVDLSATTVHNGSATLPLAAAPNITLDSTAPPPPSYLGPARTIEWLAGTGGQPAAPYTLSAYFAVGGGFSTGVGITVSNKRADINGAIQSVSGTYPALEPSMIGVSNDINGVGIGLEGYGAMGVGNTNSAALATYDLDDVLGGAGPYTAGYGKKKFMLSHRGKMFWGPSLGVTPLTSYDVSLERENPGILKMASLTGPAEWHLNALDGSGATIRLQSAGTTRLYIGAATPQTEILQSGTDVMRLNDDGSVVIGNRDGGGAVLSLRSSLGGVTVGLRIDQNSAGQSGDMLALMTQDEATVLHRFDKNGYSITKKNTAPADGDLSANEMALWFDPTNGAPKLMVKAKQADGTVKTASVALA